MSTTIFTDADRDEHGFIRLSPPPAAPAPESAPAQPHVPTQSRPPAAAKRTIAPAQRKILAACGGALLAVLLIALTVYATPSRPITTGGAPPLATAAAAFVPAPTLLPAPTAAPARMLGAYAAPDGILLGTIEETRLITPIAHYDTDWIQADVSGSGRVWLRASDLPGVALTGPDLAPHAAPLDERPPAAPPVVWSPPAPVVGVAPIEAAPTLPPTVLAAVEVVTNGQKLDAGGWCSGAHLDNPECQEGRDTGHGQKAARP